MMGRGRDPDPGEALQPALGIAAWMVPGAGHALRGERGKGALLALLILGAFVAGTVLSETRAVSRAEHPWAFWAQIGAGLPAVGMALYDKARGVEHFSYQAIQPVPRFLDCGILFTSLAGLLNFVAVLDVLVPSGRGREAGGRP